MLENPRESTSPRKKFPLLNIKDKFQGSLGFELDDTVDCSYFPFPSDNLDNSNTASQSPPTYFLVLCYKRPPNTSPRTISLGIAMFERQDIGDHIIVDELGLRSSYLPTDNERIEVSPFAELQDQRAESFSGHRGASYLTERSSV